MGKKAKPAAVFLLLLLFDQLTKLWAVKVLKPIGSIPVIRNVLEIYYVENRGAAFGIMQNKQWFFLLITLAVLAGLLWVFGKIPEEKHFAFAALQSLHLSLQKEHHLHLRSVSDPELFLSFLPEYSW